MSFVHLHCHSEYSLLDGFSNIKQLVKRAKELGMPAVGLTDHGTMHGVIEFYTQATEQGVKPIIGLEAYLAARGMRDKDSRLDKKSFHLLLLAENQTGYRNLLQIASAAQLEGFYYYPRIDRDFLAAHSEGLICTSGCMSAEAPRAIQEGNLDEARRRLDWYYEVFGRDRFFFELQHHNIPELHAINKSLLELGDRYQAQYLATNDVHYINPSDARLQDVLLAIQTGCILSDPNRMRMTDQSYYLRPPEEMAGLFGDIPGALSNTLLVAERCAVDLKSKGYHLPQFPVPDGQTDQSYLRQLCEDGLRLRYGARADDPVVRQRLEYELGVIQSMGFSAYFLIVWDLCRHARAEGIWYTARGSAAGSIVAYVLAITLVEPLHHGLIFERFLNPGRISMPDIDLDFQDDLRARMLDYCVNKYGSDKVAQIITFGTMGARASIRDVGRVMDIKLPAVDRIAKTIPNVPGKPVTVAEALQTVTELKQLYADGVTGKSPEDSLSVEATRELIDTAAQMEGVVRSVGTHAAGVVIADKPILEYLPLHRPTGNVDGTPIKTLTQFEMGILEALGMLKVDFLGLITLTIMQRACDLIRERHGVSLDLSNIPLDDPATFDLMGRGQTAGVFQVEGTGMKRYLVEMKPKNLANVVAMIALYRPGPLEFIPQYIRRMHGEEEVEYRHPSMEPIFNETFGIPVYQEQIMRAAVDLAGYSMPESDELRKAIAKKQKDKLEKHKEKFIKGAVGHGMEKQTAEAIFADWEEFARYGFNKSHAAVYGVIAVQTGYLKAHYAPEYMTALLSANRSKAEDVALYIQDCRTQNIAVLPPDVNSSGLDFTIEAQPASVTSSNAAIRFGLGAVKNVGEGPVQAILEARQGRGAFKTLDDFCQRVDLRQVGKRALECLIKVGALDAFGQRPQLLEGLEAMVNASAGHFKAQEAGQLTLFGGDTGGFTGVVLPRVKVDVPRREQLKWEKELIGLYVSDHPLQAVMDDLQTVISAYSGELSEDLHEKLVTMAGVVTNIRTHQTKKGDLMGFVSLEDLQGHLELVLFPRTWKEISPWLALEQIVVVKGRVDAKGGTPKVLVDSMSREIKVTRSIERPTPMILPGTEDDEPPPWLDNELMIPADESNGEYAEGGGDEPLQPAVDPALPATGTGVRTSPLNGNGHKPGNGHGPGNGNGNGASRQESPRMRPLPPPAAPPVLPRRLVITLQATGDLERDTRRLRRVHGLLISYPGQDRFEFHIHEQDAREFQMRFPNHTTGYCATLDQQLRELLGPDAVEVQTL